MKSLNPRVKTSGTSTALSIPGRMSRPETGSMMFGDDWAGVFIRGDNSSYYAHILRDFIKRSDDDHAIDKIALENLCSILESSDMSTSENNDQIQRMNDFDSCSF